MKGGEGVGGTAAVTVPRAAVCFREQWVSAQRTRDPGRGRDETLPDLPPLRMAVPRGWVTASGSSDVGWDLAFQCLVEAGQ